MKRGREETGRKNAGLSTYVDSPVSIITNDGRHILGLLKGFDQATNLILEGSTERIYSQEEGVEGRCTKCAAELTHCACFHDHIRTFQKSGAKGLQAAAKPSRDPRSARDPRARCRRRVMLPSHADVVSGPRRIA